MPRNDPMVSLAMVDHWHKEMPKNDPNNLYTIVTGKEDSEGQTIHIQPCLLG
jgi:hypothetical protein